MKKIVAIMVLVVLSSMFIGCGVKDGDYEVYGDSFVIYGTFSTGNETIEDYTTNLTANEDITADSNGDIAPVEYEVKYISPGDNRCMLIGEINLKLANKTDKNLILKNIELDNVGVWSEVSQEEIEKAYTGSKVYAISYKKVNDYEYKIHIEVANQTGNMLLNEGICRLRFHYEEISLGGTGQYYIVATSTKEGVFNTGEIEINNETQEGYVGIINNNQYTKIVRLYNLSNGVEELIYTNEVRPNEELKYIKLDDKLDVGQYKGKLMLSLIDVNGKEVGSVGAMVDISVKSNVYIEINLGQSKAVVNEDGSFTIKIPREDLDDNEPLTGDIVITY